MNQIKAVNLEQKTITLQNNNQIQLSDQEGEVLAKWLDKMTVKNLNVVLRKQHKNRRVNQSRMSKERKLLLKITTYKPERK